jgi:hypothetical protein
MILRRFAVAIGLFCAAVASQLPEFTQQYRQRLGGAIDELSGVITQFDQEAAGLSLDRGQGIARLKSNADVLAQQRGASMDDTLARKDRLERQRASFAVSGPLSQYAVLAEDFDPGIARQTYADFQPGIPATPAGFVTGLLGFVFGWLLTHIVAMPVRTRRQVALAPQADSWR